MTSAWKEPSGRDDRSDSPGAEPGENQLDLFEILRPLAASHNYAESPTAGARLLDLVNLDLVNLDPGDPGPASPVASGVAEPDNGEMIASPADAGDGQDVGVSDADDLRRLEESIRWLMNAGTMPLPQITPLPAVPGLSPLRHDADSLLLDPDTLFPPRAPRRGSALAAGAAKFLLVSAIAAPTAYFVASWMQFPGAAAPTDLTAVSGMVTPVALSGEPVAVEEPQEPAPLSVAALQAAHGNGIPAAQPEQATVPQPASRAAEVIVVAALAPTPEPSSVAAMPPAEAGSPPMPVVMPAKPAPRQEEIAMMIERGRVLFEAGDVAAARLFFRRAANAGDAAAAIAMGATYDPEVLTQRFIRGIEADAQEAQRWYEKAREMGRHVEMLAQRR